jgi:homoserine kinase type II
MIISPNQSLCDHFALGNLRHVSTAGGTRNTNFMIETESGFWFVRKRYNGYCATKHLTFDHGAARYLAERGVLTPCPHHARDGQSWWCDGEATWEVFPFASGRHLRDGNEEDTAALGAALARWHRVGREFPLRYEKAGSRGETDPRQLHERIAKIESESPAAATVLTDYRAAVEQAALALPDWEYSQLPHTLIHGDVQPANILLREGQVSAFVDLDWCAWQARLYDLCFAILLCCANHDTPFDGSDIWSLSQAPRLSAAAVEHFLTAYESHGAPLTTQERQALHPQLVLTWCHVRLGGALKVHASDRTPFLERAPHPAELSSGTKMNRHLPGD